MRIVFLAVDTQWLDPSADYNSFSYAAWKLDASVRSADDLRHVETLVLDLKTTDPETFFERIREFGPQLVAASTYIWSLASFLEVARLVKAWDPSVRVVLGGPAARVSVLKLEPYRDKVRYLDAIAPGEGEEVIRELGRGKDLKDVAGLILPHSLGFRATGAAERPEINRYASPYQLGTAPLHHTGFIETFRGCPISCAFCQWGEQRADRVYDADYLASHLRGLVASKASNVFFTDAAFNLSARGFRNLMTAESETGALKNFAVHGHFYPTHLKEEHLEFLDRVGKAQVSIGVQSFDEEVLRKLGRPFDVARFEGVLRDLRGRIPIDVELIYGLPGDNPRSFRETYARTLELADSVRVFYPLILPDALLERTEEYQIRFDPRTFSVESCAGWTEEDLRDGWARLVESTEEFDNRMLAPTMVGFTTPSASARTRKKRARGVPIHEGAELRALSQSVAGGLAGWAIVAARHEQGRLLLDLEGPAGTVELEIAPTGPEKRCFKERAGLGYSYRGELPASTTALLGPVIEHIHSEAAELFATIPPAHG